MIYDLGINVTKTGIEEGVMRLGFLEHLTFKSAGGREFLKEAEL